MHVLHCSPCGWRSEVDIAMRPQCPECGATLLMIIRFEPQELAEVNKLLGENAKPITEQELVR